MCGWRDERRRRYDETAGKIFNFHGVQVTMTAEEEEGLE